MLPRDPQLLREYHEATKHSEAKLRSSRHFLDFESQPLPFKIYRDTPRVALPRTLPERPVPALEALAPARERPSDGERVPDLAALARVLHDAAGITKRKRYPGGEILLRAAPNTGALYHVDLYVACGDLPDLDAGVYHFDPLAFRLDRLREGDFRGNLAEASGSEPRVAEAPVVLAAASTFWRNAWKYQARAWRHVFWDGGTLLANLVAAAGIESLAPRVVLGFADPAVEHLLGLDPQREGAVALVPLGWTLDALPPPAEPPPLHLETEPLSKEEIDYPEIRKAHEASALRNGAEAARWRGAAPVPEPPPARGPLTPIRPRERGALPQDSLESVIRRRGSSRRFDPGRSISFESFSTLLDRASAGVPADWVEPFGVSQVDFYTVVHAVEGLAPGTYVYRRADRALEQLAEGDLRARAGRVALFQELAADAAANIYCLADLDPVLDRFGSRGYRAAQLEGGIAGGRIYLAAYAQRLGCTGLTFLDDEVIDLFSPHAAGKSVMFLTAVGRPPRRRPS